LVSGANSEGGDWGSFPPKTYETNFVHTTTLDYPIVLKSPPLTALAGSVPAWHLFIRRRNQWCRWGNLW